MNNKKLGTEFEKQMCRYLAKAGYWVHFIQPDSRGAQPFDIIAVKNNTPLAIDCKTSSKHIFSIDRLEDNQVFAFEKWIEAGNTMPIIAIRCDTLEYQTIRLVPYNYLKQVQKVDLAHYDIFEVTKGNEELFSILMQIMLDILLFMQQGREKNGNNSIK